jgi:hypothetical protein
MPKVVYPPAKRPRAKLFAGCLAIFAAVAVLYLIVSFVWMVAWNAVVAGVFDGPTMDMAQSFFSLVLLTLIGGAFRSTVNSVKS